MEKVLISVMTYPTLSESYYETVCTAGFREDGSWVRIFPVPHRVLRLQKEKAYAYSKWQWIEVDLVHRPEKDDDLHRVRRPDHFGPGPGRRGLERRYRQAEGSRRGQKEGS